MYHDVERHSHSSDITNRATSGYDSVTFERHLQRTDSAKERPGAVKMSLRRQPVHDEVVPGVEVEVGVLVRREALVIEWRWKTVTAGTS